jgi:rhodanese-related sulfurtransferase
VKNLLYFLSFQIVMISSGFAAQPTFNVLKVQELVSLMKTHSSPIAIYDVNVESTRDHVGIIPGAKLLSSSSSFGADKELPSTKDTHLVFYCANTQCSASHAAAERALHLGYKNVSVMVDGIYGWKHAGQPTESISSAPQSLEPSTVSALTHFHSAIIVDVREDEERHEVVPNAQWMPMSKAQNATDWKDFEARLRKEDHRVSLRSRHAGQTCGREACSRWI